MNLFNQKEIADTMRSPLKQFTHNKEGNAAIEFAFIVPLFILLFLGCFVAFDAFRAQRVMTTSTIVVSDLTTRFVEVDDQELNNLYIAAESLLGSYVTTSDLEYTITSVVNPLGNDDDPTVVWSHSTEPSNELTTADLAQLDLPEIDDGETIIVVKAEGTHTPRLAPAFLKPTGLGLTFNVDEIAVRRPRLVREICFRENLTDVICSSN